MITFFRSDLMLLLESKTMGFFVRTQFPTTGNTAGRCPDWLAAAESVKSVLSGFQSAALRTLAKVKKNWLDPFSVGLVVKLFCLTAVSKVTTEITIPTLKPTEKENVPKVLQKAEF